MWKEWYSEKGKTIEPEVPELELLLRKSKGKNVLDFGCGEGRHTLYFAKNGYAVYGFDQSADAINEAIATLKEDNLWADLRVWDMSSLPLPYETDFFDAVIVVRVIHHGLKAGIEKLATEIDRVLRVGGLALIQEPTFSKAFEEDGSPKNKGYEVIEPGTFVEHTGREKDIPRHYFKFEELIDLFPNYEVMEHHEGSTHFKGHCLILRKARAR